MPLSTLFLILLLEGFITISVEVISIRQLIPFVGNSVVVTSLIIGVFLLFLAIGYYRGGLHTNHFIQKLHVNFLTAALFIGIGLSFLFTQLFFIAGYALHLSSTLIALFLYLLFIIAPVVYFLGQTIPLTTNLFKQQHSISRISGSALFLSTIGSFLGAILTSLVLFQYFGVAKTIVFNFFLLLFLCVLTKKDFSFLKAGILFLFSVLIYTLNIHIEKNVFIKTNNYGNYRIKEKEQNTVFYVNNTPMSVLSKNNKSIEYIEYIKHILFKDLRIKNKNILIIGAGGFAFTAAGENHNNVTYLDIDGDIKNIAEKYFLKDKIKGLFIGKEARRYLNENKKQYDVIISDAYKNPNNIPASLTSQNYFKQIKSHLKKNGIAFFNIIGSPFLNNTYSKRVDNTIKSVFKNCTRVPIKYQSLANIVYACQYTENENDEVIYTDNLSTVTLDQFGLSYR